LARGLRDGRGGGEHRELVIRRCRIRAASAGRVRRGVAGDANSACWPLAVSARAPASPLTCCRISTAQACGAAGVSGGLSVSGGPPACKRTR
jgi:hypothetical protein